MLCGEYAVLAGAPAVAAAINRRARVTVQTGAGGSATVRTLSDAEREFSFRPGPAGAIEWTDGSAVPLFDKVCQSVGGVPNAVIRVTLDTREFFDAESGAKYGFGSSAALSSALALVFGHLKSDTASVDRQAASAHRALQGGKGSGVDIATSIHGGLIEFRTGDNGGYRQLTWPEALEWVVVWSGRSASTGEQLRKLGKIDKGDAATRDLLAQSRAVADAWASGNASRVLLELQQYTVALRCFSAAMRLGIFDGGHDELQKLAVDAGTVYKPCGAGGGDVGAAFSTDRLQLESFATAAGDAGYQVLAVSPDTRGASIDSENNDG